MRATTSQEKSTVIGWKRTKKYASLFTSNKSCFMIANLGYLG